MKYFLGLSKIETYWITGTVLIIMTATFFNLQISLRRSRDSQRKDDLRSAANAVENFKNNFAYYPTSDQGKITACGEPRIVSEKQIFNICQWGVDSIADLRLPQDMHQAKGASYVYISDGTRYSLYASLEGLDEPEYSKEVIAKEVHCGDRICNFSIASDN